MEVISTVQENKSELEQYANVPERKVFQVPTSEKDPFEKIVSEVITDENDNYWSHLIVKVANMVFVWS